MVSWEIVFSDEVAVWYQGLDLKTMNKADAVLSLLAEKGNQLRMPHSKALGSGLYELRFDANRVSHRITYVFEPVAKVITLTAFRKQRQNERQEIERARRVQERYLRARGEGKLDD